MSEQGEPIMVERHSMVDVTDAEGNTRPPESLGVTPLTVTPADELPSPIDEAHRLGITVEDYLQG